MWRGIGIVGVSGRGNPQGCPLERRTTGQWPELDLENTGEGERYDCLARARIDRPCGLGRDREESYRDRLAFGREPSRSERNGAISLIGSHASAAFCRALYNANGFVYVP
jgi:hypothetical protein